MERLKHMKESLMACVEGQMGNLQQVDAKELGEVIDMIKDLSEAVYYCTITEAMEEKGEEKKEYHYYTPVNYNSYYQDRDMDKGYGRMYYPGQPRDSMGRFTSDGRRNYGGDMGYSGSGSGSSSSGNGTSNGSGSRSFSEPMMMEYRDPNEGRSSEYRKTYMESKHSHKDQAKKMHDLEKYAQELTSDIVEMIKDATPEEKQFLTKKMTMLANKIDNV